MTEPTSPEASSKVIADGISDGVRRSKVKLTDRRLQFITLFLVAFCILTSVWQQHQTEITRQAQRAAKAYCMQTNAGNVRVNAIIDQLAQNAQNSTGLTVEQKATALASYKQLHLPIVDCSHLAGS